MERAVDWESLFSRSSGWTGADGIYWILLSGNKSPGSATNGRTLFVISDTFIGEVNDSGERLPGSTLVNSILAGQVGDEPDPAKTFWPKDGLGNTDPVFVPIRLGRNPGTGTG